MKVFVDYINWYPGHIAKAERELKEKLSLIDVVIEVVDSRIPFSSKYPNLEKITKDKPRITLFNKSDLADLNKLDLWLKFYEGSASHVSVKTNSNMNNTKEIINLILKLAIPMLEKRKEKGLLPRPIRTVVVGLPNVGKSTIINRLTKSSKTKTGMKAGVTKIQQWVRINDKIELLDTPGIISPKISSQEIATKLAAVSSIGEKAFDDEFVAEELLKILSVSYGEIVAKYYELGDSELSIDNIAFSRNWIIKGGMPDRKRTAAFILSNFRTGKIGKFVLDEPTF